LPGDKKQKVGCEAGKTNQNEKKKKKVLEL